MYFIKDGTLECIDDRAHVSANNDWPLFSWLPEKRVATLKGRGAHFGELSIFLDEPRAYSVRASSEGGATVWRLSEDAFDGLNISRVDDALKLRRVLRGKYKSSGGGGGGEEGSSSSSSAGATLDAFFRFVVPSTTTREEEEDDNNNDTTDRMIDSATSVIRELVSHQNSEKIKHRFEDVARGALRATDDSLRETLVKQIKKGLLTPTNGKKRDIDILARTIRSGGVALLCWILLARLCCSLLVGVAWTRASLVIPPTQSSAQPHRQLFVQTYTMLNIIFAPIVVALQCAGTPLIFSKFQRYLQHVEETFVSRKTRSLYPLWSQACALAMGFVTNMVIQFVTSMMGIGLGTLIGYCRWR